MPSDADTPEFDEQDQSEVFDEDVMGDEGLGPSADMRVFEELPDVYDVTSKLGDADVGDDLRAADADEIEDEELDDINLDDDDEADDDTLDDELEDEPEDSAALEEEDDLDDVDGVADLEDDEVEVTAVGDIDNAATRTRPATTNPRTSCRTRDVQELGYAEDGGRGRAEEEDEEEDEIESSDADRKAGAGKPAAGQSGEAADRAADRLTEEEMAALDQKERQDVLLDEGAVEGPSPASDPVSVNGSH
jgi:hypothetical protein